jgi:eukaryotic-like serine/threonine-protein kinase
MSATIHDYQRILSTLLAPAATDALLRGENPHSTLKPTLAVDSRAVTASAPRLETGLQHLLDTLPSISCTADLSAEYTVTGELGRGGMGVVLRATQRSLGREVAIKRVREDRVSPAASQQLIHEARIAGALDHPSVLPIHAFGVDEDRQPTLVMKRIQGHSWAERLADPEHPGWRAQSADERITQQVELLIQVCNAVELAHQRGILHRDLKPDNVMLGDLGEVYVVDWGVAALIDELEQQEEPGIVGTPHYMAPEMAYGHRADVRSDVYLLGACLHETLTGQPRHLGPDLLSVLFKAATSQHFDYPDTVPAELARIANKATATDPDARYQHAADLRDALSDYLHHRAAISLHDQALLRLVEVEQALQQDPALADITTRMKQAEARFGFQQALIQWHEYDEAAAGLRRCLIAQLELELRLGDADAASTLLHQLPDAPPALHARLDQLRQRQRDDAQRHSELVRVEHDHNVSVSSRPRGLSTLVVALAWCILGAASLYMRDQLGIPVNHTTNILVALAGTAILLISAVSVAKHVEWNDYNRRFFGAILISCSSVTGLRTLAWLLDLSVPQIIRIEMFVVFVLACVVNLTFRLRVAPAIALYALLSLLGAHTGQVIETYTVGLAVLAASIGWRNYRT